MFKKCTTLPVTSTEVKGATGSRTTRIERQFMYETHVGDWVEDVVFLVVPKSVRDCILGIDRLRSFGIVIDATQEAIIIQHKVISYKNYDIEILQLEHRTLLTLEDEDVHDDDRLYSRPEPTTEKGAGRCQK